MIKTKKLLASLSMEIPAMETDAEGLLKGGFNAFGSVGADVSMLGNGNCNCGCTSNGTCPNSDNDNCNCKCESNQNCGSCKPSSPTPQPTYASKLTGAFGLETSFLF